MLLEAQFAKDRQRVDRDDFARGCGRSRARWRSSQVRARGRVAVAAITRARLFISIFLIAICVPPCQKRASFHRTVHRIAKGSVVAVHITVPTQNGWKAIALSDGARQELFISTPMGKEDLEAALRKAAAGV